ncbi:substrate-binding periplasmic protein [Alkalimonas amylolytica]|uniref:Polar amino acid transport system substrate-binding protein n=1 Tax=Alkalimonas amylolytica TaxID=152573 RepID=A0A1H3YJK3_ALKAM|nr:transporter substrate-binding domain-containing protein [Alkalimonas amylolytica]SEA11122.1 polar amino acid transport system substrate-binding protein [Alkalimonas amylolytica]
MTGIRTTFALLIGFLLPVSLQAAPSAAEPIELEWCLDDFPNRHHYPEHGNPYGPTVDFMQELAKRAGVQLRFSPSTPFARCLRMMEQGKTDVMTSLNASTERAQYMHLIPYDHARPEVILLRQESPDIWSVAELSHLNLMVIRGYTYNADILNIIARHQQTIEVDSLDSGLNMLLLNRADALLAPVQSSRNLIQTNPRYHGQFKTASLAIQLAEPRYVHIGLSKASPNARLEKQLRLAVESMIADDLVHRYFHALPGAPAQ